MENEQRKVLIYSYSKVWKVEKKIYSIQNLVLPVPVDPWQILYFLCTWFVTNVVFGVIPGFHQIPAVLRSIILPFFISKFIMTKKLDGKNPIRYAIGMIIFLAAEKGKVRERFRIQPKKQPKIKLDWNCSEGHRLRLEE